MNNLEVQFLKKHPSYAFNAISGFYPLNGELLRKYRNVLFWDDVCENEEIEWSTGLVQTFLKYLKDKKGKLNSILHYNNKLPWSVEFIRQFETLWYWDILGEKSEIQNNPLIQKTFEKYLEPVNAWITSLKISNTGTVSSFSGNNHSPEIKPLTLGEVEIQKNNIDWVTFSVDERTCNWDFQFLNALEKYIDFSQLCGNRKAWTNCFGKLTEEEIDSILGDREVQEQVVYSTPQITMSDIDKSHYEIPKCLTFDYFLVTNKK
jgi:hypothetical protein